MKTLGLNDAETVPNSAKIVPNRSEIVPNRSKQFPMRPERFQTTPHETGEGLMNQKNDAKSFWSAMLRA